ncbi:MAG: hypothetical protein KDA65_17385 [Planctomycetaceae bacterium]|nr:hypothetical protein [Planctomycetaceae bacterium]
MKKPVRTMTRKRGREWNEVDSFYFFSVLFLIGWCVAIFYNDFWSPVPFFSGLMGLTSLIIAILSHRYAMRFGVKRYEIFEDRMTLLLQNEEVKTFRFADVTRLSWPLRYHDDSLDTPPEKYWKLEIETTKEILELPIDALSLNNLRHLLLNLRRKIPIELQEFWNPYFETRGYRILEKQKLPPSEIARLKSEGVPFSTRKELDRNILKMTSAVTVAAGLGGWIIGHPWYILFGLVVLILGLLLRYGTPTYEFEGRTDFSSSSFPLVLFLMVLASILAVGVIIHLADLHVQYPHLAQYRRLFGWTTLILLLAILLGPLGLFLYSRTREQKTAEWQQGEEQRKARLKQRQSETLEKYRIRDEDLVA